jgi:hypothetical protein
MLQKKLYKTNEDIRQIDLQRLFQLARETQNQSTKVPVAD